MKYSVDRKFVHTLSGETMYRVRVEWPSGGVQYEVYTKEQLDMIPEVLRYGDKETWD